MPNNADVRSLEQLSHFLGHTKTFRTQLLKELEELQLELRRMTNWIDVEAAQYWQHELQKAQRVFVEAQDALSRCMSYVRESERRPCTEQKAHLKKAKDRRALCEEKLRLARGASQAWERNNRKHQGKWQRCQDMGESDLLVAIQKLQQQVTTLEEYANVRSAASRTKPSRSASENDPSVETSVPSVSRSKEEST